MAKTAFRSRPKTSVQADRLQPSSQHRVMAGSWMRTPRHSSSWSSYAACCLRHWLRLFLLQPPNLNDRYTFLQRQHCLHVWLLSHFYVYTPDLLTVFSVMWRSVCTNLIFSLCSYHICCHYSERSVWEHLIFSLCCHCSERSVCAHLIFSLCSQSSVGLCVHIWSSHCAVITVRVCMYISDHLTVLLL